MLRVCGSLAVALALLAPSAAEAHGFGRPVVAAYPAVSYYTPAVSYYAPAVSYYAPAVSYYAPPVSYYAPAVSYYPPVTSYYAPAAPVTVSTYRYGLFGRRSLTTVNYGVPAVSYYAPPVVVPRRAAFYSPVVIYR